MKRIGYTKEMSADGVVSAYPLPSKKELGGHYQHEYYQKKISSSYQTEYTDDELSHKRMWAKHHIFSLDNVMSENREQRRLLEIGSGEGFFISEAMSQNWDAQGIDYSKFGVNRFNPIASSRVKEGDAYEFLGECVEKEKKFDACSLTNVLEHVLDPEALLLLLRQVTSATGVIQITVPNDYSPIQERMKEMGHIQEDYWFTPPTHLHYFNTNTLSAFLSRIKFEILDSYANFPIEFYLAHPSSNYVKDPSRGKASHQARVVIDLLMMKRGFDAFHQYCQALAECGIGRDITLIVRPI